MACTQGTRRASIRFHPDLIPLHDRVAEEGKKIGFNKRMINILEEYYAMKDAEEKKKTVTR